MPAGEGAVADLARAVGDVYRQAEGELLELVAREVRAAVERADREDPGGQAIPLQVQAAGIARLRAGAQRILARLARHGLGATILGVLTEAQTRGVQAADRELRAWLGRQARDYETRTNTAALAAFARNLADLDRSVQHSILRQVDDVFRAAVARTVVPHVVGAMPDRLDMAKQALAELVERGITGFVDKAGRRWELPTYVEMATRSAAGRVMVQGQLDRFAARGRHLVYVSNHAQECRLCRPFEHRVLSNGGRAGTVRVQHATDDGVMVTVEVFATVVEAYAAGLMHPNCKHSLSLYLPGVTRLEPDRAKLADEQGDRDRQHLRHLERQVRKAKRARDAALDATDKRAALDRVRELNAAIAEHVEQSGLLRQRNRERPNGAR